MKKNIVSLFMLMILTFTLAIFANTPEVQGATNPFLTKKNDNTGQAVKAPAQRAASRFATKDVESNKKSGPYAEIMLKVSLWQKEIRSKLTGFARDIKKNPSGKSLWLFFAFAFAYGIVHAVGPGHGKSVVCAYFLSRGGSMLAASFMSWVITLVHVGSATIAVCLAYLFFSSGMSGFENFNHHLQTGSYALVTAIGVWLIVGALRSFKKKPEKCSDSSKNDSFKEIATVALVTGLVPCPGAAIILVYTLSTGLLWAGLIAMIFLATGMAVTTSLFAFTAAKTRCIMDSAAGASKLSLIYSILALCGALGIFAFGLLMLTAHVA